MANLAIENLAIIISAAGNSSRLGQPKQLVTKDGLSLLRNIAKMANKFSHSVICVVGYDAENISSELESLDIDCLVNTNWRQGMGSSIACGVNYLNENIDGVMILLCDQWALTEHDLEILVARWQATPDKIIASRYFDKQDNSDVIGAPAIFPKSYFKQLSELKETGARKLLMKNINDVIQVNLINAALDLDTADDLEQLRQAYIK